MTMITILILIFSFVLPIRFYSSYLTKLLVYSNSITISLCFICFLWISGRWFFWFFSCFIFFNFNSRCLFSCNSFLLDHSWFLIFCNFFSFFSFLRLEHALLSDHFFHSDSFKLCLKLSRNLNRVFLVYRMLMDHWSRDRSLNLKLTI